MPNKLPVVYETTTGDRGNGMPSRWSAEPQPQRWHVSVADRAARGDTLISVITAKGDAVATLAIDGRYNEDDQELAEFVAWTTAAARMLWAAGPRLAAGTAPAAVWGDVAEAWKYAGQSAYFAWANEVRDYGTANVTANL